MATRKRKMPATTEEPEVMLSLSEAGAYFNRTGQTIGRWVHDGLLKAVRLPNGRMAVPKSQVEAVFRASNYESNEGN